MTGDGARRNSLDPTTEAFVANPYDAYEAARRHCPVAEVAEGSWVVLGRDEIVQVLGDTDRFTSERNLDGDYPVTSETGDILSTSEFFARGMFNADPPDHTRLRGLLADFFSPRNVRRLGPEIRGVAGSLVDGFKDRGGADLISALAYPLPMKVICTLIGVPDEDHGMVKRWSEDWTALLVLPLSEERQVECARSMVAYDAYYRELLGARSADPRDDIAGVLARASSGSDPTCTTQESIVILRSLLLAGHETASGLIGNTLYHLLRTGTWRDVVARPELIPAAVEETLRFDPSSQSTARVAVADVPIGGQVIPKGARVHPMTGSVGRDRAHDEDVDSFRLDRGQASRHLAFGYGLHYCLGAALARSEACAALEVLASALPRLRPADDFQAEFLPGGFSFRGLKSLPVVW
ncbi:cytochrome P450 [Streptosporangium sp. OZ121]|uniref:cytochrome P450 n=1 Tax=Streptosporangium sp. OZ121 TaxID=3444183 RepID=UPI003F79D4F0